MRNGLKSSFFLYCLLLLGCSTGIERTGYTLEEVEHFEESSQCHIKIKKDANLTGYEFRLMGQAKVFDTQFSMKCDEAYVFSLLKKEACALSADLINITSESRRIFGVPATRWK